MSTGNLSLDILLNSIKADVSRDRNDSVQEIKNAFPSLTESEAHDVFRLIRTSLLQRATDSASLVVTAPPLFDIRAKSTINTVKDMLSHAQSSILITGYSLSDYFQDSINTIIRKSQKGVFVKFFVNQIESQKCFDDLIAFKGRFLKIYNYPGNKADSMSALHAKVISVDKQQTLITSANLSYHGQEGNIELGTLVDSRTIAKQVEDVFTQLVFNKVFMEL